MFFLVVLFGLYNGLFVLPVALSFLGPKAYGSEETKSEEKGLKEEVEPFKPIIKNGAAVEPRSV